MADDDVSKIKPEIRKRHSPLRSRWWLDGMRQAVPRLTSLSLPGIWNLLERFDLVYKRGRRSVHWPDPAYLSKRARVRWAWSEAQRDPERAVLL